MANKKRRGFDEGYDETEKILEDLESRIAQEFKKANGDIAKKYADYLASFETERKKQQALLEAGKITQKDFKDWEIRHIGMNNRWKTLRNQLAEDYYNADLIARGIVFDTMKDVYALNHNFAIYKVMHDGNITFSYTLYDHKTVERLFRENPKLLPDPGKIMREKLKKGEAVAWNMKQVQSSLIQSLLQGESVKDAAARLELVTEKDMNAALRNARTMITGAQNAGRQDGFEDAAEKGIRLKKKWISTLDGRTRHEHRVLHGQTVDIDEPFEVEGEEIMYPGDPSADPSLVYNCRCSVESVIDGYERDTVTKSPKMGDLSFADWLKGGK